MTESGVRIRVLNPLWTEDEYRDEWRKNSLHANFLLMYTEEMDDDGWVEYRDYDEMNRKMQIRFMYPDEYRFKKTIS